MYISFVTIGVPLSLSILMGARREVICSNTMCVLYFSVYICSNILSLGNTRSLANKNWNKIRTPSKVLSGYRIRNTQLIFYLIHDNNIDFTKNITQKYNEFICLGA